MPDTFSVLFDHSPNPMWIYEIPTLRILKVNDAAVATYGYTEQEFLSMAINNIRPRFDESKLNDYLSKDADELSSKFINAGVWKHQNKNGDAVYAQINIGKIQYAGLNCRIIVAPDVTDLVHSQQDIHIREQFLNSLIDSQTNFLIRINHRGEIHIC